MSRDNDDYVEDLLKGLSKAEPMSEFEIRKFEKLIDRQASEYKRTSQNKGFRFPTAIAAGIAIIFGAVFLLSGNSGVIRQANEINQSSAESTSDSSNDGTGGTDGVATSAAPSKPEVGEGSNGDSGVFGDSGSAADSKVSVYQTNLDYSSDLEKIKKLIKIGTSPISLTSLPNTFQQCAIQQGVSASTLAFDRGLFQGQRIGAYFSGSDKSDYKIILVTSDCTLIAEL